MKESLAALKRHEGEYLMTEFSFLGELIPLKLNSIFSKKLFL